MLLLLCDLELGQLGHLLTQPHLCWKHPTVIGGPLANTASGVGEGSVPRPDLAFPENPVLFLCLKTPGGPKLRPSDVISQSRTNIYVPQVLCLVLGVHHRWDRQGP